MANMFPFSLNPPHPPMYPFVMKLEGIVPYRLYILIKYISRCITKRMYLEKPKQQVLWNGGSRRIDQETKKEKRKIKNYNICSSHEDIGVSILLLLLSKNYLKRSIRASVWPLVFLLFRLCMVINHVQDTSFHFCYKHMEEQFLYMFLYT
jgi:hypothetical protein